MKYLIYVFILTTFTSVNILAQNDESFKDVVFKCGFEPSSMDINKDDSKLIIGGENKTVVVYDLISQKTIFEKEAHYLPVAKVQFSNIQDGFYTVGDKSFKLWLSGADEPEKLFTGSHTSITDLDMTPDEENFVGGSYEKRFRYWNSTLPDSPEEIDTDQKKSIISVAISDDNQLIASGSLDSTIEIWNTDSSTRKNKILAHAGPVCCLEFIGNDRFLLSASHDGYTKLWDVATGEILKVYSGHTQAVNAISVSPDENFLLTASYDNSINLYAIATGDLIHRYSYHKAPVFDVVWNHDGSEFFSCDKEGVVAEWTVDKKLFVDFYYNDEIQHEYETNKLFSPRRKGESKDDYKVREEKAELEKQQLIETYYAKYLETLNNKVSLKD